MIFLFLEKQQQISSVLLTCSNSYVIRTKVRICFYPFMDRTCVSNPDALCQCNSVQSLALNSLSFPKKCKEKSIPEQFISPQSNISSCSSFLLSVVNSVEKASVMQKIVYDRNFGFCLEVRQKQGFGRVWWFGRNGVSEHLIYTNVGLFSTA